MGAYNTASSASFDCTFYDGSVDLDCVCFESSPTATASTLTASTLTTSTSATSKTLTSTTLISATTTNSTTVAFDIPEAVVGGAFRHGCHVIVSTCVAHFLIA